jgi:hypothetical protein
MYRILFAFTTLALILATSSAAAQPLGTFRWQLQPYCNVVTLAVTQNGGIFTLDGADDQCAAAPAASMLGTAFFNPDGSIGIGLHLVAVPDAAPMHISVVLDTATLSGTWSDSAGHAGAFVFNPPVPAVGSPRPAGGGLSGVAVTTVVAGAGLTGGGAGPVNLAVAFAGTGSLASAARSDHTHAAPGVGNTAVGSLAMAVSTGSSNTAVGADALRANTSGSANTAVGHLALSGNHSGIGNTALGSLALLFSTTGITNTAVGANALSSNVSGNDNTAVGVASASSNISGSRNVAVGRGALRVGTGNGALGFSSSTAVGFEALENAQDPENTAVGDSALRGVNQGVGNSAVGYRALSSLNTGFRNLAFGHMSGSTLLNGTDNIYVGSGVGGAANESLTIRVGRTSGIAHAATYIGGIVGRTVDGATDLPVLVDGSGKLGTSVSSARAKRDVRDLAPDETGIQGLRAVSVRYRPELGRGDGLQYGLIAEEVAEVLPALVVHGEDGAPRAVRYHLLPALLVAEVQRLQRAHAAQEAAILELRTELNRRLAEIERLAKTRDRQ